MQDKPRPSTIVRIRRRGYDETHELDGTRFRSYTLTPEGTHVVELDATAADGAEFLPPRKRKSKTPA
jgi:hypothetical protein